MLELMIVFAVVTISLNVGWPSLTNMAIRTRVAEALSLAEGPKRDINLMCSEMSSGTAVSNRSIGYSAVRAEFVREITLSGTCADPVILVLTENTGASVDPVLTIAGRAESARGNNPLIWSCIGDGLAAHLPDTCRR